MLYSDRIRTACRIMYEAHLHDLDKGGYPYVFHPFLLATQMEDEDAVCTALLHDVIEDHGEEWSIGRLRTEGFSEQVLHALSLLTHEPGIPYMDYVHRIAADPIARRVKMADLKHNMDSTRNNGIRAPKYALYQEALAYLEANDPEMK